MDILIWSALSKPKVYFSKKAENILKCEVIKSQNFYEIGGLLLGYKFFNRYAVKDVTFTEEIIKPSKTEFVLDGEFHTHSAEKISKFYRPKLRIIGIWHSHICDFDIFSKQDKITNSILFNQFGNIISLIVTKPHEEVFLKVYEVYKNNKERICIIKGDTMDGKNRCSNCVYWKFGKCTITDKPKHDKICDCGMFKQKAESK